MEPTRTEQASVALVAGGSRGLGLLVARELLERGWAVAICARDAAELATARELLERPGLPAVRDYVCDVADRTAVRELVAAVERDLGPVATAIHVAGIIQVAPLESTDLDLFDEAIDVMTRGPVHLVDAVLRGMRARGRGQIGIVTSVGGVVSVPHLLPYSTAKFGAVGFSRGLSAELAGTGITATTIIPGLLRTGSHLHAQFGGDSPAEYAWFAPGASAPLLAMDAERAAERIVRGVLAGRNQVVLTPLAKVGMRVGGVAPSTTTTVMKVVARLLPDAQGPRGEVVKGETARRRLDSPLVERLTTLGERAARRFNERRAGGPVPPR